MKLVKASEVTRKLEKALFTTVQVLLSPCRHVSVAGMIEKAAFTRYCEACAGLLKWQERTRKQFSPLWRSYEAGAGLFKCQERSRKPFTPQWWSCEARAGLFKCQERSRKRFSPLWRSNESRVGLFKCQE